MNRIVLTTSLCVALALGAAGGWYAAQSRQPGHVTQTRSEAAPQGRVLYWYDPMKPDVHFDKPGKSPFMDMELVPRYAEDGASAEGVRIDPTLTQNTGVKLAKAARGEIADDVEVAGTVAFNDRDVVNVQARTGGIVERAYPHTVGDVVTAGAPLADIRVPEWAAAQYEYLALRGDAELAAAARARLLQLGMSESQVKHLERSGEAQAVVTVSAPRAGMIAEHGVREGMTVSPGTPLAQIRGLASVWVEADVPEAQSAGLKVGARAQVRLAAQPEALLEGRVVALVPELRADTRTVRVRVELPNKQGTLRPGMVARIALAPATGTAALWVPSETVIATGRRHVVIVAEEGGRFVPVEVSVGRERGGRSEVLAGLTEGQQVVASGQFMIDSEASLRGVLARMGTGTSSATSPEPAGSKSVSREAPGHGAQGHDGHAHEEPAHEATAAPEGTGTVVAIGKDTITLAHDPLPELNWPAMTMPFPVMDPHALHGVKVGDRVKFSLMMHGQQAMIDTLSRVEGDKR
ncbi:efflux RND transporter periplasmic adaptor subunit [Niveibacterium sp. SC-1]|uniref:efflux RND transporter periplasmic adaptor subunit n=1 Tax=Niveibacterium sp. SC-1 TaxID=3135646 RepID=UPI00311E6C97